MWGGPRPASELDEVVPQVSFVDDVKFQRVLTQVRAPKRFPLKRRAGSDRSPVVFDRPKPEGWMSIPENENWDDYFPDSTCRSPRCHDPCPSTSAQASGVSQSEPSDPARVGGSAPGSADPSDEFEILGKNDLAGLDDELKATDDIANARRKGPMR